MNNIDVSVITNKPNIYNTDQDEGVSRSSSHCQRIIFPISKQEQSHILTMTDSRSRKHRLFQPLKSQKRKPDYVINNRDLCKTNENRIKKSQIETKREDNRISNYEDCLKSRAKITFKIPQISDYYIGQKLQTTAHRVNYALRMNSLINPKSLLQPQEEKQQKKEKQFSAPLPELKSLRQTKKKDSSKQKRQLQPYAILQKKKINQTMVIYVLIGLSVLGFTLNMLLH